MNNKKDQGLNFGLFNISLMNSHPINFEISGLKWVIRLHSFNF